MLPSFYLGTDHYANKCRYDGAVNYCHGSCLRSLAALNGDCFESCISRKKCQVSDHPNKRLWGGGVNEEWRAAQILMHMKERERTILFIFP